MITKNENTNDSSYFLSSELSLCATLVALGLPLYSLDKSNPRRAIFIFLRNQLIEDTIEKFWKKELRVEPLTYFEAQRYLKSRLYSNQE